VHLLIGWAETGLLLCAVHKKNQGFELARFLLLFFIEMGV
jgi:hypothetical protein